MIVPARKLLLHPAYGRLSEPLADDTSESPQMLAVSCHRPMGVLLPVLRP